MSKKYILCISGASGVGKTTLVNKLQKKYSEQQEWRFEHFDSIGVPSSDEMIEKYSSGEEWQKAMTHEWIKKLIDEYPEKNVVIFEGQMNVRFIQEAFQENSFTQYGIILIDADEKDVTSRLIDQRKQPELVTQDMKNWLIFLRKQATELKIPIINTSEKSESAAMQELEVILVAGNKR